MTSVPPSSQQQKKKKKRAGKDGKDASKDEEELSPEDLQLKEDIALLVERVQDVDPGVQLLALERLRAEIRSSTASMTSVPKPLKFLRPHYSALTGFFEKMTSHSNKVLLADILAVLAMTMDEAGKRASLSYKLQGTLDDLESWGHDFVRNLAGEVALEHVRRTEAAEQQHQPVHEDDLLELVRRIVPFHMQHNSEPDACDLLTEMGRTAEIVESIDYASPGAQSRYQRVITYLTACAHYYPEPDNSALRRAAMAVARRAKERAQALVLALGLCDATAAADIIAECSSAAERRQMAFLLARHGAVGAAELASSAAERAGADADERDSLSSIANNQKLSELFLLGGADLGILEPRDPEELIRPPSSSAAAAAPTMVAGAGPDTTSRQSLALTFVNAFANAGFGANDLLLGKEGSKWIFKHKDQGMLSATAALGLTMLWDVEALSAIDKYIYSTEPFIRAGALLAIGAVNATVRSEVDPALALIQEQLESAKDACVRVGGLLGLGLAYAGTARDDLLPVLTPALEAATAGVDVQGAAALALGLVFAGSCKGDVLEALISTLMDAKEAFLASTNVRFVCLAIGLVVLGRGDACDAAAEMCRTLRQPVSEYALLCVQTCAYAASGNVLKIQYLLQNIAEHVRQEKEKAAAAASTAPQPPTTATGASSSGGGASANAPKPTSGSGTSAAAAGTGTTPAQEDTSGLHAEGVAVLGIALTAMGEDMGDQMAGRALDHVLQYGDPYARRAVPLALGLLSVSNPRVGVVDTLAKLCHDADADVAACAVVALGIVSSGTNNSRVAGMLQQLAVYHEANPSLLFAVRIAQGLLHLGKGTLSLSPLHSDRSLLCVPAAAGLLVVLHACLDIRGTLLGRMHYLLYSLAVTAYPRMLLTVDDTPAMQPVHTPVRVGQAVDIAGQAGRPKAITGFQTHTTPVLIGFGERAELASDDYTSLSPFLEGVVLLEKNPAATTATAPEPMKE